MLLTAHTVLVIDLVNFLLRKLKCFPYNMEQMRMMLNI